MGLIKSAGAFASNIYKYATSYIETILPKIKLIGFINKRAGLFTRLGEAVYTGIKTDTFDLSSDNIKSVIDDIKESDIEISKTESVIADIRKRYKTDWEEYRNNINSHNTQENTTVDKNIDAEPEDFDKAK